MAATVADPRQSHDSEQISPATIAHHTVYENTQNLQQTISVNGEHNRTWWVRYLSKNVLPLRSAAYGPNSAILSTQTFNRILFHVCNGRDFGVQKTKSGDRGRIACTATLRHIRHQSTTAQARRKYFFSAGSQRMVPPVSLPF